VEWDGIFHPMGKLRRYLFVVSIDSSLYLAIGFWFLQATHTYPCDTAMDIPKGLALWNKWHNIAVRGSHILWLLLDVCVFDTRLYRVFTRNTAFAPLVCSLFYFTGILGKGVMTSVYPYEFYQPSNAGRYNLMIGTVILSVVCHLSLVKIFGFVKKWTGVVDTEAQNLLDGIDMEEEEEEEEGEMLSTSSMGSKTPLTSPLIVTPRMSRSRTQMSAKNRIREYGAPSPDTPRWTPRSRTPVMSADGESPWLGYNNLSVVLQNSPVPTRRLGTPRTPRTPRTPLSPK
ncbi:hypothetical protein KIPB_002855, partial [Kipferlia bialata]